MSPTANIAAVTFWATMTALAIAWWPRDARLPVRRAAVVETLLAALSLALAYWLHGASCEAASPGSRVIVALKAVALGMAASLSSAAAIVAGISHPRLVEGSVLALLGIIGAIASFFIVGTFWNLEVLCAGD